MSNQPEALWLVEVMPYLEGGERGQWIIDAAAELRRLSAENESLRQIVQDFPPVEAELREVSDRAHRLEAQRDALLGKLKTAVVRAELRREGAVDVEVIRAAIKAVEEEQK